MQQLHHFANLLPWSALPELGLEGNEKLTPRQPNKRISAALGIIPFRCVSGTKLGNRRPTSPRSAVGHEVANASHKAPRVNRDKTTCDDRKDHDRPVNPVHTSLPFPTQRMDDRTLYDGSALLLF